MELVVFDLDGTLLDRNSTISDYTSETLKLLSRHGIAYTVATGRTMHGARAILEGHRFQLPQIYKNGVMIWNPQQQSYSISRTLTLSELDSVVSAYSETGLTPFVFTLDDAYNSTVYHPLVESEADKALLRFLSLDGSVGTRSISELPGDAAVTHVNTIGPPSAIQGVLDRVAGEAHLVAYSGLAFEGPNWHWLDVHHSDASKGGAVNDLKALLGLERVICFGDSDNDLSMFEAADECYAPANANDAIKSAASAVIGHHDQDGIARFLRQRFSLDPY